MNMGTNELIKKRIQNFINEVEGFNHFPDKEISSQTQNNSKVFEDFIQKQLKKHFVNSVIFKSSSQEHPDFFIIPKKDYKEIILTKKKINKRIIGNWENKYGKNYPKVEVKSVKSSAYNILLNDTPPQPDTLYICFFRKDKKVIINTYEVSRKKLSQFKDITKIEAKNLSRKTRKVWSKCMGESRDIGFNCFPRLNMSLDGKKNMNKNNADGKIEKILMRAE